MANVHNIFVYLHLSPKQIRVAILCKIFTLNQQKYEITSLHDVQKIKILVNYKNLKFIISFTAKNRIEYSFVNLNNRL